MQKLNIHPVNKIASILLLVVSLFITGCSLENNYIAKYKKLEPELLGLLVPGKFQGKSLGKYLLKDILTPTDPIYNKLLEEGVINPSSFIMYSSADCFSLTTRVKESNGYFKDIVVVNNLNEGHFACNINHLYTMNQDEYVNKLTIKVSKLSDIMNLFIIEN